MSLIDRRDDPRVVSEALTEPALGVHAGAAEAGLRSAMVSVPSGELLSIAHEYEQSGRAADAERILNYILSTMPDNPDALHLMGVVSYRKGELERALSLMERAIAVGIDVALYYRNIGEIYRVLGKLEQAVEAARKSIALNPLDPLA